MPVEHKRACNKSEVESQVGKKDSTNCKSWFACRIIGKGSKCLEDALVAMGTENANAYKNGPCTVSPSTIDELCGKPKFAP